ncbi:MAG: transposase [Verrucomicrobiales bacterium]|nr:transposase [Verrucomicrobiales bacterium]
MNAYPSRLSERSCMGNSGIPSGRPGRTPGAAALTAFPVLSAHTAGALILAFGWIKLIWTDSSYAGLLENDVKSIPRHRKGKLETVKRSDDVQGFKVLSKRGIGEGIFGWLIQSRRRLVRDCGAKISHSESMIHIFMVKRMLARIARWLLLRQPRRQDRLAHAV